MTLLSLLLLAGCPSPSGNAANANTTAAPKQKDNRVVVLFYSDEKQKASEEARLDALLKEGWKVVSTETRSANRTIGEVSKVEWTITVVLEREKP